MCNMHTLCVVHMMCIVHDCDPRHYDGEMAHREGKGAAMTVAEQSRGEGIAAVEHESMLLGRHLSLISGHRNGRAMLDRSAYTLLARIRISPMSIAELAQVTGLDASTLNRQTSALRSEGLVARIADPDGGRSRKFRITERGEDLYERQRLTNIHALRQVLSEWSEGDVERFAELLTLFNRGIEEVSGRVWERPPRVPAPRGDSR